MEGKDFFDPQRSYRGGRSGRGCGRGWRDEAQHPDNQFQGRWDDRRANFQDGRYPNQQWRQRESGSDLNQNTKREQQQFDLRQNLNQGRQQEQADRRPQEDVQKDKGKEVPNKGNSTNESHMGKGAEEGKDNLGICKRCGKIGHKSEACFKPIQCPRCKKEGHVVRACLEILP
jgi:hypothetical protein